MPPLSQTIRISCFVVGVLFLRFVSPAQNQPGFIRYSLPEGLSQNSVHCIIQDQSGFLWVGTQNGLNRFDGYSFTVLKHVPEDPSSLSSSYIRCLLEGPPGVLWVGTRNGLNRLDLSCGSVERFLYDPTRKTSLPDNHINALWRDHSGALWVGTERGGLSRLDMETGWFEHYRYDPDKPASLNSNNVKDIIRDKKGILWVATDKGLCRMVGADNHFESFIPPSAPSFGTSFEVLCLYEDRLGQLWAGTQDGIFLISHQVGKPEPLKQCYQKIHYLPGERVTNIIEGRLGNIWVSIYNKGLSRLAPCSGRIENFQNDPNDPSSLAHNLIGDIYMDQEGILWAGTNGGLNRIDDQSARFRHYSHHPNDPKSLPSPLVWSVAEDKTGHLWIGTQAGLARLDPHSGEMVKNYSFDGAPAPSNPVDALLADREGQLWIGADGLARMDLQTGRLKVFRYTPGEGSSLGSNSIKTLYEDRAGNIWASTNSGLEFYDRQTGSFQQFGHSKRWPDSLSTINIKCFFEDRSGRFWIGTRNQGLYLLNRTTGQITSFQNDPDDPASLSNNFVLDIFQDKANSLWVSTYGGGLNHFDPEKGKFEPLREKDGLPNDFVYGTLEDSRGRLWLATDRGLSRFDPSSKAFRNFGPADGLEISEFNPNAIFQSPKTGHIYLGGVNGLVTFHPDSIQDNTYIPPVVFTSLQRYNANEAGGVPMINYWLSGKGALYLSHEDNILEFQFAALSFRHPSRNQYKYQLESFSDNWIELGTTHSVTFTNLDPGAYTLHVTGSNDYGIWNEAGCSLEIVITPPWYWNFWSKCIYLLLSVVFIYSLYRFQLNRKLAIAEAYRLKELDAIKTRLYTNITHEFRTPLTIIQGMAEQEIEQEGHLPPEKAFENAQMIKRNSDRLLRLVTQMLDLHKLESGSMTLNRVNGDLIAYLNYIVESFHSYAESKDIRLQFHSEMKTLSMDYDPDKTLIVVSNLLSNALKFTEEGGAVNLSVSRVDNQVIIKVSDTGIGIPPEQLPFIFDRFYQAHPSSSVASEGAGIGLALTKELVKLLDGEITVKSTFGEGAVFTIVFPYANEAARDNTDDKLQVTATIHSFIPPLAPATVNDQLLTVQSAQRPLPLALLIEDNRDVVRYLSYCLEADYRIEVASNGLEGIEKALKIVPDIIVSDVMMPGKDGFEVCKILKSDERSSHIPIILLTAKADIGSKLKGLERGADAYLPKPFYKEELLIRLRKLLELRQSLRQYYLSLATGTEGSNPLPKTSAPERKEDAFVKKLRTIVEEHIDDYDFSVANLCRIAAMSHSQVHRKITALTGYSANRFIRFIRLSKAKALLMETEKNIAEVASETGFNDPVYFTRVFRKEFGAPPSTFRKSGDES